MHLCDGELLLHFLLLLIDGEVGLGGALLHFASCRRGDAASNHVTAGLQDFEGYSQELKPGKGVARAPQKDIAIGMDPPVTSILHVGRCLLDFK